MLSNKPRELTTAKKICDLYGTPFDPTSRVLQLMTHHKILRAVQGAHGGYEIIADLSKISMSTLTNIIIGPIEITNCFRGKNSRCALKEPCAIQAPMAYINKELENLFKIISVKEVIKAKTDAKKYNKRTKV